MSAILVFVKEVLGRKPERKRPIGGHGHGLKYKVKCSLDKHIVNV
jgi:hypothetical protein